jgi:hypothetical protein
LESVIRKAKGVPEITLGKRVPWKTVEDICETELHLWKAYTKQNWRNILN